MKRRTAIGAAGAVAVTAVGALVLLGSRAGADLDPLNGGCTGVVDAAGNLVRTSDGSPLLVRLGPEPEPNPNRGGYSALKAAEAGNAASLNRAGAPPEVPIEVPVIHADQVGGTATLARC